VTIDGALASAGDRPRAGQRVAVRPAPPPPSAAQPQAIPLAVLYEDADLVVIDKPAGMVVHPAPGHADGTLVNALLHHFGALPGEDAARPGIVHRLDAQTSGVMVVARTAAAREGLMQAFATHAIERAYLAIAVGHPPAKVTYETLHGRHPRDRKRFSSKVVRGKRALTHVEVLERLHGASLVRCTLETGRTHQIRVHLADHGFPLLGDPTYGKTPKDARVRAAASALGRQALHAAVLGFAHPITGRALRFETPPPSDFQAALSALR
jgi:23S rRNA pseudouridine1911/1915/1917 synthase